MKAKVLIDRKNLTMIATKVSVMHIHHYGLAFATKQRRFNLKVSVSMMEYLGWPFGFRRDRARRISTLSFGKVLFRLDVYQ